MARLAVYYYMYVHGYPIAVAVHAGLSYFGSSAGEGLIQRIVTDVTGSQAMPWVSYATSLVNSLLRYSGGDRVFSLGTSLLNGILRALLSPSTVPATLMGLMPRTSQED